MVPPACGHVGDPHSGNRSLRAVGRVSLPGENLEAGVGIEPAYTALQAAGFVMNSIDCGTQPPG
jgi:hypothetical protein